jgi:hypothetical protein
MHAGIVIAAGLIGLLPDNGPAEGPRDAAVRDTTYEGTWVTTNRRLDGRMTCVVRGLGNERWSGHFYGTWRGVDFSYRVDFRGPPEKLNGTAQIDGADYAWTGAIKSGTPGTFDGSFDGTRYRGRFQLAQKR